ncbi:MAG: sensor histidine kinase [Caulobacteraceae bacterium]|nr:sensor histidine kinase [Caulobacteraceae bacterium]
MTASDDRNGSLPQGAGEMAARIRNHDWAATPVGPIEAWPEAIKTAVDLMLDSTFPVSLHCGPDYVQIYNDAYVPLIGDRHPIALGGRTLETFRELHEVLKPLFERVRAGEAVHQEAQLFRYAKSGPVEDTWFTMSHQPVRDGGRVIAILSVGVEVTRQVRAEERLKLVISELNHRVKNNLAIVQAMAGQTFRGATDPFAASEDFLDRLVALARANDALTEERSASIDLEAVANQALAAHVGQRKRLDFDGPRVELRAPVALALSMALHELATNAMKYGAWSNGHGKVSLAWRLQPDGEAPPRLHLTWRERDGPPVRPPERRGFGSRLIERALAAQLGGRARLAFEPEGIVCEIDAPIPVQGPGV